MNLSPFGMMMMIAGAALVARWASEDLARLRDTRARESLRLEAVKDGALELTLSGEVARIPLATIGGVSVGEYHAGRGVLLEITRPQAVSGARLPLAGSTKDADVIFLTEHQCNADAAELARRIDELRSKGGYRS